MDVSRILIVGAGELGATLGDYLRAKGHNVFLWDADPAKVPAQRSLHDIVPIVDHVFLCVPSWAIRSVLSDAVSVLKSSTTVVCFSKGMDTANGHMTTGELLPELLPRFQPFVVVGGPMLAAGIAAGKNAAVVFASPFNAAASVIADLFASSVFAVEVSNDIFGVSLAGILKNIYAIGLGIADGLALDGNAKGWLAARAMNEMLGIADILGADKKMILGTPGLADFIATGFSPYSRNREIGDEIVKYGKCDLRGEGTVSLPPLMVRLGGHAGQFPLLNVIKKIAVDCEPAGPAMATYFTGKD